MATHSSTLAWKLPWTEEPGRLQTMGSLRVRHDWATSLTFHFRALVKEMATHSSILVWRIPGTGEPVRVAIYGVAESQTRLKWLSSSSITMFIITIQKHEGILLVHFKSLKILLEVFKINTIFVTTHLSHSFKKCCHILWLYCHRRRSEIIFFS